MGPTRRPRVRQGNLRPAPHAQSPGHRPQAPPGLLHRRLPAVLGFRPSRVIHAVNDFCSEVVWWWRQLIFGTTLRAIRVARAPQVVLESGAVLATRGGFTEVLVADIVWVIESLNLVVN